MGESQDQIHVQEPRTYSKGEWIAAGVVFVVGLILMFAIMDSPSERGRKARERVDRMADDRKAEERQREAVAVALRSRDEFDSAIRDDVTSRRARLEKAAYKVATSDKHGVRIDRYFLRDGRVILCTTTITGNAPAIFTCDSQL